MGYHPFVYSIILFFNTVWVLLIGPIFIRITQVNELTTTCCQYSRIFNFCNSEKQLKRTIQDLFIAGSETVTTTMKWTCLLLALHPEVQKRVQTEIDEICAERMPTMRDKSLMPYTEAVVMECQRLGNIALFSVPRAVTCDTTVNGYNVPKGTWVFVNRYGVHANTRYWRNPKKFDPNRFLDKDGKVTWPEAFIPFGMGK